ncbi:SWIM zinc finger family protein [Antrihabitans stalactiti]|uniref:SWIM zinc finger family protein n=1 Tax=Antrihabitans stalactiti TaxID=2584121 RepID=A0A848KJ08_9NOCA|nr:SWIM zinc finger family protein [Antrihabitans stalactiti]NMN97806.1 SWIM zinc finger family protein [Antrihabitans stalactiti]
MSQPALTADQVAALSPDATSLTAARRLGARWSRTGTHATALWGLCEGSGAKPYQTVVDLSGPAYKCSCPSRKFPCKHALSLMFMWAEGTVPEQDSPPPYATEWLEARESKAQRADPKARTANPQTAIQRIERVTSGLEDLDVWLTDQIRTGLAQADRSWVAFETVAARMVDSQAPGVASTLRRLPAMIATHTDWPERLLAEYAQLHLLIKAHRRIAELPEPLAASVRAHIGYPVSAESVLANQPVRDRWMVLGLRSTEENSLYSRKVWLRGRESRKWAVLLDFSYGSPSFPVDTPPPGSLIEANVHYYPGAAPLRAKLGDRHSRPEPFTTLPGATIDNALEDFAHAIGTDPWLRSWPVCLADVVPVTTNGTWHLVDTNGQAIPLSTSIDELALWQLLGLSGGHPLNVIGEWTSGGVIASSVFSAGRVVNL